MSIDRSLDGSEILSDTVSRVHGCASESGRDGAGGGSAKAPEQATLKRESEVVVGLGWEAARDGSREARRGARGGVERLLRLAAYLPATERALVRSVYEDGASMAKVGVLSGRDAWEVRRTLKRTVARVSRPEFVLAARAQGDAAREGGGGWAWPDDLREVARLCILEGQSIRAAAARLGRSVHSVRSTRAAIVAMARAGGGKG